MLCKICRFPIERKRALAALDTCREHGDQQAVRELERKRLQAVPAGNKMAAQFFSETALKAVLLDAGRKTSAVVLDSTSNVSPRQQNFLPKRRKQIGIWWSRDKVTGKQLAHAWYFGESADQIKAQGAIRSVLFENAER